MAEARSNTQFPLGQVAKTAIDAELQAFQDGIELGRKYADLAARKVAAWAEENPGQMLLAGIAAGFVLGKLMFRPRRRLAELDLDDD